MGKQKYRRIDVARPTHTDDGRELCPLCPTDISLIPDDVGGLKCPTPQFHPVVVPE